MLYDVDGKSYKEKYEIFCTKTYIPIFSQPWWMDAVCGEENWDVFVIETSGTYKAAMPYYVELRNGYKLITKARHTQNNGIIFNYPENQKYCSKLDFEEKCINLCCDFIESLGLDKYEQQFHYNVTNWLPYSWRGYSEMTRYTYVIEDTSDIELVEQNYSYAIRNEIRKAEKFVKVGEDLNLEELYRINKLSFESKGTEIPYSLAFLRRVDEACRKRNCCKSFYAYDDEGNIHSIVYIVWDEKTVYYLLSGTDPIFKANQANSLLIRESIRYASKLGLQYDFEGSVIRPIEHIVRSFGGVQKPYFRIYKVFNKNLDESLVNRWSPYVDIK